MGSVRVVVEVRMAVGARMAVEVRMAVAGHTEAVVRMVVVEAGTAVEARTMGVASLHSGACRAPEKARAVCVHWRLGIWYLVRSEMKATHLAGLMD